MLGGLSSITMLIRADSTFLLRFGASEVDNGLSSKAGTFSILVDPWLSGDSTIFHRKFAVAKLKVPSSIKHLSEIPAPDVVVISQDKTDHCHEATLKQLDPELPNTIIFAHPAAAKRIRGWKYFRASKVVGFPAYNDQRPDTVIRFKIPAASPEGQPGEATIVFIPTKFDVTGTHNAIGFTYRAPAQTLPSPLMSPVMTRIPTNGSRQSSRAAPTYALMPPTPPESPILSQFSESSRGPQLEIPKAPQGPLKKLRSRSHGALRAAARAQSEGSMSTTDLSAIPPLPPLPLSARTASPHLHLPISPAASLASSTTSSSSSRRPRTISVLYAPHGASYAAIRNYASAHLIQHAGLPLTLLLHSFDRVTNAWYLGGNIISGLPGGLEIARNLLARTWISAHDEDKENSGLAVTKITVNRYTVAEVRKLLAEADEWKSPRKERRSSLSSRGPPQPAKSKAPWTDVRQMGCGEEMVLTAT